MKKPTSIFLIVLAIGIFYTVTRPLWSGVKELQASASGYQYVIQNTAKLGDTRDKLLASYDAIPRSEVDRLGQVLPGNVDTVQLALGLDTIASRYGISIKDVKVEKQDQSTNLISLNSAAIPYDKATVSFTFVSNYQGFASFLGDIERNLRLMDVKSLSFKVDDSGLYEHKVTVDTYWLK